MKLGKIMQAFIALEHLKSQEMRVTEAIKLQRRYAQLRDIRDQYAETRTEIVKLIAELDDTGLPLFRDGSVVRREDGDNTEFVRRMTELDDTDVDLEIVPIELLLEDGKLTPTEIEALMDFFIFEYGVS